jgi:uncharacterized membrane protein YfcA
MMFGIVLGTAAGSGLIADSGTRYATAALGITLLIYAITGLARLPFKVPVSAGEWAGPTVGLATGLVAGATGVFVIPAVPYLAALDLKRDDLVQALGLSFTVSTISLAAGLAWHGALPLNALSGSSLAIVPTLIGMAAGRLLRSLASPEVFRRWFFIGLTAIGVEIIWHSVQ